MCGGPGVCFFCFYVTDTASTRSRGRTVDCLAYPSARTSSTVTMTLPMLAEPSGQHQPALTLACHSVCRGFVFKVTGPSPSRGQFGVRLPDPRPVVPHPVTVVFLCLFNRHWFTSVPGTSLPGWGLPFGGMSLRYPGCSKRHACVYYYGTYYKAVCVGGGG